MIESLGGEEAADVPSVYAEEGTRCHNLAEIEASHAFGLTTDEQYKTFKAAWLKKAEEHGDDVEEMERHVAAYVGFLHERMEAMGPGTTIYFEKRVQTGIPGCWGTGDAVLVSPTRVEVVDFKYGQGIVVRAEDNPQLKLYGLGVLEKFGDVLGNTETVGMHIHQPRAGGMSHFSMSAEDLRAWREDEVLPLARETQSPDARFGPSEAACRFCPAAGVCAPRAAYVAQRDFGNPDLLSPEELAAAFRSLPEIRDWCNAVEAAALHQAYSEGVPLPGLKVVLSGGRRNITDADEAVKVLVAAGYAVEQVARLGMKPLSDLERLVGKKRLPEVLGDLLRKSDGKPALVEEDDSRPAISPTTEAQKDFSDEQVV